jgi:hypothetical protein
VNAVINTAIPQGGNAMKHSISTLALATLFAIASLAQAHAQSHVSQVNVPFAFSCGSEHFPAGTYTISTLDKFPFIASLSSGAKLPACRAMIESMSTSASTDRPGYVVFRKYGGNYFLAEDHTIGGVTIRFGKSEKERSVAREYAQSQMHPGQVQLALLNDAAPGR